MYTFIIQQNNKGEIEYDFAFQLTQAIKYQNWYYGEKKYRYKYCSDISNLKIKRNKNLYIPIGSMNFVLKFYEIYHGISDIYPIMIPNKLKKYLERKVYDDISQLKPNKQYFVKSANTFKDFTDIVRPVDIPNDRAVIISDVMDIVSEWRCFICDNKLMDVKHYSGDFSCFYNLNTILQIINDYKNSPSSYTLDIAVLSNNKNAIIEIHQFFSCGLYGFSDYNSLPKMFILTHNDILRGYRGQ